MLVVESSLTGCARWADVQRTLAQGLGGLRMQQRVAQVVRRGGGGGGGSGWARWEWLAVVVAVGGHASAMLCREKPRDESRKTIAAQVGRFHNLKPDPKTRHLVELRQRPSPPVQPPYDRHLAASVCTAHDDNDNDDGDGDDDERRARRWAARAASGERAARSARAHTAFFDIIHLGTVFF